MRSLCLRSRNASYGSHVAPTPLAHTHTPAGILGCDKTQVFADLIDSIAALVVSAIILVAVVGPVFEWVKQFCVLSCRLCRGEPLGGGGVSKSGDPYDELHFPDSNTYHPPDILSRSGRTSTGVSLDFSTVAGLGVYAESYDESGAPLGGVVGGGAAGANADAEAQHARGLSFNTRGQTAERISGLDLL